MQSTATVRRLRTSLGTWVAIEATGSAGDTVELALEAAFAAIDRIDVLMHPTRAGSDLARINAAPVHARIHIAPDTHDVLHLARRFHQTTAGVFDPCLPAQDGRLRDLELGPSGADGGSWVICRAPVALDLGGIAKGYAIDRAVDALRQHECHCGLVNAGGDLRIFGARSETILLRRTDHTFQPLELRDQALAVSDMDASQPPPEHQGYYTRDIPTRSRPPSGGRRYAAVAAKDAATADALTKCVLLSPKSVAEESLRYWQAHWLNVTQ